MINHLEAMATAYDQALEDAGITDPANPYRRLLDDRREFVHQQVTDGYGEIVDADGDDVLDTDVLDAILDAHDEWLTQQQPAETCASYSYSGDRCSREPGHPAEHWAVNAAGSPCLYWRR